MKRAIDETERRREIQMRYNKEHGIIPKTIVKGIRDIIEIEREDNETARTKKKSEHSAKKMSSAERERLIDTLTKEMREASRKLEFEQAAFIRDRIAALREEGERSSRASGRKKKQ
jgi:excinuclease ABC subunit B